MFAGPASRKRGATRSLLPPVLSCLALAACGSNGGGSAGNGQAAAPAENAAQAQAAGPMPRILAAMGALLVDPGSARYSNLREGSVGSFCGTVAVRQPDGTHAAPVPFVVTPEGVAHVSATPHLSWEAPEDPFPTAYARWCATPQELEAMRAAIAASPAPPAPDEPLPLDEPADDDAAPVVPPPEPGAARQPVRQPVPKWEPADPNDVSFTNAVRRPDQ